MKRDPIAGLPALNLKVQDPKGQNLMLNRDILRRTYGAVRDISQYFYNVSKSTHEESDAAESTLSISFTESQDGTITFIANQLPTLDRQQGRFLTHLWRNTTLVAPHPSRAQKALQNTLLLARAITFALEVGDVVSHLLEDGELVDLSSRTDAQQLRVPAEVGAALLNRDIQAMLRELLAALGEEGVGAIVMGSDPRSPELRTECVIPATDIFVEFQAGKSL